jgi:hypothetical protein
MNAYLAALMLAAAPARDAGVTAARDGGLAAAPDAGVLLPSLLATAAPTFKWEAPPGVLTEIPMSGEMQALGIPVRARALVVKGKLSELGEHFLRSFQKQGLYIAPDQDKGMAENIITGLDFNAMISYSAVFQKNGGDLYTVVLGEANVGAINETRPTDFAPIHPLGMNTVRANTEGFRTLFYDLDGVPGTELLRFYDEKMVAAGYRKTDQPGVYLRGRDELTVRMIRKGNKSNVGIKLRTALPDESPALKMK